MVGDYRELQRLKVKAEEKSKAEKEEKEKTAKEEQAPTAGTGATGATGASTDTGEEQTSVQMFKQRCSRAASTGYAEENFHSSSEALDEDGTRATQKGRI